MTTTTDWPTVLQQIEAGERGPELQEHLANLRRWSRIAAERQQLSEQDVADAKQIAALEKEISPLWERLLAVVASRAQRTADNQRLANEQAQLQAWLDAHRTAR
jgi:hypothetical protein